MKRITANQYKTSERYYKLPKILWNLVRKLNIRVALTSVLFALAHHPGTILAWIIGHQKYLFIQLFDFCIM